MLERLPNLPRVRRIPPSFAAGANAFVFSGAQILWIILFPYLAERLGLGVAAVAGAFGAGSVLFLAGAPFWSAFSDRRGRGPALLAGIAGLFLAVAALVLLVRTPPASPALAFAWLLASRAVYGLTASAITPVAQAWQIDAGPDAPRALHRHTLAQNLGRLAALAFAVAGGGAAALVAGSIGLSAIALLAGLTVLARPLPASTPAIRETAGRASGTAWRGPLAIASLFACFVESLGSTLAAHVRAGFALDGVRAARRTAELLLVCALAAVAAQLLGRGFPRARPRTAFGLGAFGLAAGSALLLSADGVGALRGAMVAIAIGVAWIPPVYLARLERGSPSTGVGARAGRAAAAHTLGYALGGSLAALALRFGEAGRAAVLGALALLLLFAAVAERRHADDPVAGYAR